MTDDPRAYARRSDPETSHEAARSLGEEALSSTQEIVQDVLRTVGPVCDQDLTKAIHKRDYPVLAESTYRHRRTDLVEMGLVEWTGEWKTLPNGRRSRIWRALTEQEIRAKQNGNAVQAELGL
jgi:hypothetical protein